MTEQRTAISAWERAEVERSAVEAALIPERSLRVSDRILERYASPPAETAYPLEYSYHLLGDVRNQTILDFGCGSGANAILLSARGGRVVGIDISEDLVRLATQRLAMHDRASGTHFIVGSAHDLPLRDQSVHVVFGMAILHHLDLDLVAREVHRVLQPGGRAIFQEPVRNSRVLRFVRSLIPIRDPDVSPYERPLTDAEIRRFASRFGSVSVRAFGLPHVRLAERLHAGRRMAGRAYDTDARLLRRWPALATIAAIRVICVEKSRGQ